MQEAFNTGTLDITKQYSIKNSRTPRTEPEEGGLGAVLGSPSETFAEVSARLTGGGRFGRAWAVSQEGRERHAISPHRIRPNDQTQ